MGEIDGPIQTDAINHFKYSRVWTTLSQSSERPHMLCNARVQLKAEFLSQTTSPQGSLLCNTNASLRLSQHAATPCFAQGPHCQDSSVPRNKTKKNKSKTKETTKKIPHKIPDHVKFTSSSVVYSLSLPRTSGIVPDVLTFSRLLCLQLFHISLFHIRAVFSSFFAFPPPESPPQGTQEDFIAVRAQCVRQIQVCSSALDFSPNSCGSDCNLLH